MLAVGTLNSLAKLRIIIDYAKENDRKNCECVKTFKNTGSSFDVDKKRIGAALNATPTPSFSS